MFLFYFRAAETRYSLLPWTCHVSVMIPEREFDAMFPLHFCQRNIIVACFLYVPLYGLKLLSSSKTYIKYCAILAPRYHEVFIVRGRQRRIAMHQVCAELCEVLEASVFYTELCAC